MIRLIANWAAKRAYVFKEHFSAATTELSAKAALKRAQESRDLIARTTKEADDIEARIKEVEAMLENGYYECENGHEMPDAGEHARAEGGKAVLCPSCNQAMKFIKRSDMTGQEQYESDKERKEAEKIAENKRAEIAQQEEQLKNQENTAKVLMQQATRNREFAELLRKL